MENDILSLIEALGSPFCSDDGVGRTLPTDDVLGLYDLAFRNRVGLLFLLKQRRAAWSAELNKALTRLNARYEATLNVIAETAELLNSIDPREYAVFKSIRPYPATPNDTDILCLGNRRSYKRLRCVLESNEYILLEEKPLQVTYAHPSIKKADIEVGRKRKGGIYFIDLYEDIGTDYFVYFNKARLRDKLIIQNLLGVPVSTLQEDVDLAVMLYHNVFPERTFQLEHFYVPLYLLSRFTDAQQRNLIRILKDNNLTVAARTNLSLISELHKVVFGFVPTIIDNLLNELGQNRREMQFFKAHSYRIPYLFTPRTFISCFFEKLQDFRAVRSVLRQSVHMLDPRFTVDVLKVLWKRLTSSPYEQS